MNNNNNYYYYYNYNTTEMNNSLRLLLCSTSAVSALACVWCLRCEPHHGGHPGVRCVCVCGGAIRRGKATGGREIRARERGVRGTCVSQRKYRNLACLFDCYIQDIMCTTSSTAVNH